MLKRCMPAHPGRCTRRESAEGAVLPVPRVEPADLAWERHMDVHVYIGVTDLQHGIAFYTQGLGLRLRRRLATNWVELEGASVPLFLLVSERPQEFSGPWTVHLDFITEPLWPGSLEAMRPPSVSMSATAFTWSGSSVRWVANLPVGRMSCSCSVCCIPPCRRPAKPGSPRQRHTGWL